jgi:AhpD family alkylhydroperoxidase
MPYQSTTQGDTMANNYQQVTRDISAALAEIRKEVPDVLKGFNGMAQAASREGVLSHKNKELIAMAIAITARCEGCLGYHAQTLVKLGVTRQEFMEMLGVAVYMGGGPSLMTAAEALMAFEEFAETKK